MTLGSGVWLLFFWALSGSEPDVSMKAFPTQDDCEAALATLQESGSMDGSCVGLRSAEGWWIPW